MKCLDQLDMAVMAGAVTTIGCAIVFFAYLGLDRGPLVPPAPPTEARWLEETLSQAINEAVAAPAEAAAAVEKTEAELGRAIVTLTRVTTRDREFIPALLRDAKAAEQARRAFMEGVFKLPADWQGPAFRERLLAEETMAQPVLGRRIVTAARGLIDAMESAETRYGRAVVAAQQARDRATNEPAASTATLLAASTVMSALAKRTEASPEPVMLREPAFGFGSIGDGTVLPILMAAAALCVLAAAGMGLRERGPSLRTITMLCDVHKRDVTVEMLVSDDTPYEVVRCSAFNGAPVTCDKHCLMRPAARAAA